MLLEEVKAMENNLQAVENHRQSRREDGTHSRSNNTTPAAHNSRPNRTVRFVQRQTSRPPRSDTHRRSNGNRHRTKSRPNDGERQSSRPVSRPPTSDRERDRSRGKSANASHTQAANTDSTANCFNCGKLGHYSRNCPDRPRVFAAQVIDEDEGSQPLGGDRETDDHHENDGKVTEDAAERSASGHSEEDPNGSQYDSDRGTESPVDYVEYVEAYSSDDDDENTVFIRAARVPDEPIPIPRDWYPIDVLNALSPEIRERVFVTRKKEEDTNWSPPPDAEDDDPLRELPVYLINMGYTSDEQYADADWLERLATRQPEEFQSLTGYYPPKPPRCDECGECSPRVEETHYRDSEGIITPRYRMVCERHITSTTIRTMDALDDASTRNARSENNAQEEASELIPIPEGWYPIDVLQALNNDERTALFITRKLEQDPMWVPNETPKDEDPKGELSADLSQLGYTSADMLADAHWLEDLLNSDYTLFQRVTGYRKRYDCPVCGDCAPRIGEIPTEDFEGNVYHRLGLVCGRTRLSPLTNRVSSSSPCIRAMGTADDAPRVYRSSMRRPMGTIRRPQRVDGEQLCLAAYVKINGVKAYTLFDSGSTTDSISPDFTRVAQIPVKTLEDPVTLQLGCVGSRSKINYGTEVDLEFASVTNSTYLDVANLDKYDSILGTPFLRRHGISLDFESQEIVIRGKLRIPALSEGEGTAATVSFPRSTRPTRKITPRN